MEQSVVSLMGHLQLLLYMYVCILYVYIIAALWFGSSLVLVWSSPLRLVQ